MFNRQLMPFEAYRFSRLRASSSPVVRLGSLLLFAAFLPFKARSFLPILFE
jgi:hypothetical protein